ncbi:DUF262 domain-containing protein [Idiomarina zobellii]|nr:DUF262 domain-containing protein [Idiomarina zobellii]
MNKPDREFKMHLNLGQVTLIDLVEQVERKEVLINKEYQRGSGLWPDSARSYFIDTILEGYPFPKIYLYQIFNEMVNRPIKEVVDGQQRLTTIIDFYSNKFRLTSASRDYKGMKFEDLDDDAKQRFISYQIEVSTILSAKRSELLEMFRRINAYTAPLSAAEKRHATYQGAFKWFVVEMSDKYSPALEGLKVFTSKQLARMHDSEFIADLILALESGIVQKSASSIEKLYKKYEKEFPHSDYYYEVIDSFFQVLATDFEPLYDTFMMKSYALNSLFCAYTHCKFGLPGVEQFTDVRPDLEFKIDKERVLPKLEELASAHENQDEDGEHKVYVKACMSSTTKAPQRRARFKVLCDVLTH